jgi:hypothetical protein
MGTRTGARGMLSAAVLAIGVVTTFPGVAAAAKVSTVTLNIQDGHLFRGVVSSSAAACVVGRKVKLIRIEPDGSRTLVTHTFATESGHYSTSIPQQSGNRYFARINRKVTPSGKVCLADRSPTRTV